jgi:hypothetical protein
MTTLFTIELTINMPDGGRHAKQLLNLYFEDMPADIDEAASILCGADKALQERKFARLTLKRADVWPGAAGSLEIFALLSVFSEDSGFVKQVIAQYMDGFPGCLKKAIGVHFSHTPFPPNVSLQPTNWTVEVH